MGLLKNIFGKNNDLVKSYGDFWNWFQKNQQTFFKAVKQGENLEKNFFNKLSTKLGEIREGYFYLTGMSDENTVELIFTADGEVKNFYFVEELVKYAPQIEGWLFTAHKPASDIKEVSIEMGAHKFNDGNLSFYPNLMPAFPDEIDITIIHDDFNEENASDIRRGAFIFLDNFLGELNFATAIDNCDVSGRKEAGQELVPIEKLTDYLVWRQKEFVEKYDGVRFDTENDTYSSFTAELENGNSLVAVIDTELLNWDSKPSHPWILKIKAEYNGDDNNGMPDKKTYELLNVLEDEILIELKDSDGYLSIGRQTANSVREIYFACKEFRKPSRVLHEIEQKYSSKLAFSNDIYKDKYWQSFDRFINHE